MFYFSEKITLGNSLDRVVSLHRTLKRRWLLILNQKKRKNLIIIYILLS